MEKAGEVKYANVIPGSPLEQVIDHLVGQHWLTPDKVDDLTNAIRGAIETTDLSGNEGWRELRRKVSEATGDTFDIYNAPRDIGSLKGQRWGAPQIVKSFVKTNG